MTNTMTTYYAKTTLTTVIANDPSGRMPNMTKDYTIEARNIEEAKALLKGFHPEIKEINEVITMEEENARRQMRSEAWQRSLERYDREREEKKNKQIARDTAKANELGMTYEEYKEHKKLEAKIRKVNREIAELEKQLAEKKNKLDYYLKKRA